MLRKLSFSAGIGLFLTVALFSRQSAAQANLYPDTLWIPVTFYDYDVGTASTNPDFEIAITSNTPGMVAENLDSQRKPIPTALACPSPISNPPAACHLAEWFRVSGAAGSDNSLKFVGDSSNIQAQRWYWTTASGGALPPYPGRSGEFVGPNFSETYDMRNIIIYDSLPFIHLGTLNPAQIGVYEFYRDQFFWLDGRGFGEQPAGKGHNFGFTMELHTAFTYKAGLIFTFTGDDDTWTFINGKRVIDLGGRHIPATATISLDTIPGFVEGQRYPIDFFFAERHTIGSAIRITSNVIAAQPSNLRIVVSGDSICPGDEIIITGTLYDNKGMAYPTLSDSISWSIKPSTKKPGDNLSSLKNDTTRFTAGNDSLRTVEVVGVYQTDSATITNSARIYVKNCTNQPSILRITASGDSICPGAQVKIIGTLLDAKGQTYPVLGDQISWTIEPSSKSPGDNLSSVKNDTTFFTAGSNSERFALVIGSYQVGSRTMLDTVRIYIKNCLPSLTSATTRDLNGNGLIDHIDMVFSGKVNLDSSMLAGFLVKGNGYTFQPGGIIKLSDSTYRLMLRENVTTAPQTSWTPVLTISARNVIKPAVNFPTKDGCPPVVWSVTKYVADDNNRFKDTIIITMSEKIQSPTGGPFNKDTPPSEVFSTWVYTEGAYVKIDTLLTGISRFSSVKDDSIFVIAMENGKDISTENFINIREEKNSIKDGKGNFPNPVNQKVRVTMGGLVFGVLVGPPGRPSFEFGPLTFKHEPQAVTRSLAGQGTVITLKNLTRPSNPEDAKKVEASMKILDVVGNTVNWAKTYDLFSTIPNAGGTAPKLFLYWDGLNNEGMAVAPGVYRVVMYINYPASSKIPDVQKVIKVGIKR